MTFLKNFRLGLNSYSEAIEFIARHKLYRYFLYPLVINIALYAFGVSAIGEFSNIVGSHLNDWITTDSWDFYGSDAAIWLTEHIISFLIHIVLFIVLYFIIGYGVLILLSPVYSLVSEKTAEILSNSQSNFNLSQFLNDIARGVRLALRNMLIELGLTVVLFFISFIPFVGLFTTVILFIISAYFYGFSFMDYTLERRKYNSSNSILFIKTNKGLAIGNGLVFSLFLLIPYLGIFIAGFASIVSVVAATISTEKIMTETSSNTSQNA